jgi:Glycosyl hydrolase family 12
MATLPIGLNGDLFNITSTSSASVAWSYGANGGLTAAVTFSKLTLSSFGVAGYPDIAYGPIASGGSSLGAALDLPATVGAIEQQPTWLLAHYTILDTQRVPLDFAYDIFLAQTGAPDSAASLELMIWTDAQNGATPEGALVTSVILPTLINGVLNANEKWNVYEGPPGASSHPVVTFELASPLPNGSVNVDLSQILSDLGSSSNIYSAISSGSDGVSVQALEDSYIDSVSLGSEFVPPSSAGSGTYTFSWTLQNVSVATDPLIEAATPLVLGGTAYAQGNPYTSGSLNINAGSVLDLAAAAVIQGGTVTVPGASQVIAQGGPGASSTIEYATVSNAGTLEAAGGATLMLYVTTVQDKVGGVVEAASGSTVLLQGATVSGGTLKTLGGGEIVVAEDCEFIGLTNTGTVVVNDKNALTLSGTVANTGTFLIAAQGDLTDLTVALGNVTLTGNGDIVLAGSAGNASITTPGPPATLINTGNLIEGAGTIGGANLTLINQAAGVIDGNSASGALTLTATTSNAGLIEGTTSRGLVIAAAVTNAKTIAAIGTDATLAIAATIIGRSTSLISASGSGATLELDDAIISGGTFETSGKSAIIETVGATSDMINGAAIASGLVEATSGSSLVLSGGTVAGSAAVAAMSGSTAIVSGLFIDSGTVTVSGSLMIAANATLETATGGTALLSGNVSNSGTLFASGAHSLIEIAGAAVVNGGGIAEVGNGIIDIAASGDNKNVTFQAGGIGGLELSDTRDDPTAFGGTVSGFGQNVHQFIELTDVASSGATLSYVSNTSSTGVLTVSSGGAAVASIDLAGHYVTSNFHISSGAGGSVEIVDPPVVAGGFVQSANIALFGCYVAASFVTAADGATLIAETPETTSPAPLLGHPIAE